MSNYPDDVRQHDHDPRSPFYEGHEECEECGEEEDECKCDGEAIEANCEILQGYAERFREKRMLARVGIKDD